MAHFLSGPNHQYFDNSGNILSLGSVTVYAAGTTTLIDSYPTIADAIARTNANTNPVPLDAYGRANIVLGASSKIVVKNSAGTPIYTVDNIGEDSVLLDNNGRPYIKANATSTAVNWLKVTNASTGNKVILDTDGSDATPNLKIQAADGTGTVELVSPVFTGNLTQTGNQTITGNLTLTGNVSVTGNNAITGASSVTYEDSRTNTTVRPETVTAPTSGTPAAGLGVGKLFRAESADESPSDFGAIDFVATDVTAGSEDTDFQVHTRVAGAALKKAYAMRVTGVGDYLFTGAATATRTITFPDTSVNLGGVWQLVSSATASSSASIEFTGLTSSYTRYILQCYYLIPATDNVNLLLTVSTNNGSSYVATGYYYGNHTATSAGGTSSGADNTTSFVIGNGLSNVSTEPFWGSCELNNVGVAQSMAINGTASSIDANSKGRIYVHGGYVTSNSVNAIKVAMSSGNIASGTFKLYGLMI